MATIEDKIILSVQTGEAVTNVGQLKQNIRDLKDRLEDLTIGTDEYQNTLKELKVNQAALKDAMYGTASSMEQITKDANGLSDSYNGLVKQLADLKQEWRAVDQSTEEGRARFVELGKQINETNDKLKAMDASVGVYGRNVGNYKSALDGLAGGFTATAGNAGRVINPLKNMNAGLKAMSTTPVIAILGLLANILTKVMDNLKSSEENANAAGKAFSAFAGAGDLVKNVMQVLGKLVTSVAAGISNLMQALIPALREAAALREQIAVREAELAVEQRENVKLAADAELAVARLRADAADKANKSAEERIALLEAAKSVAMKQAQAELDAAKAAYEIEQLRAKTAQNSTEENNALAQAYAAMRKAETDYFNTERSLNKEISAAQKQMVAEAKKRAKILADIDAEELRRRVADMERVRDHNKDDVESWESAAIEAADRKKALAEQEAEAARKAREEELKELFDANESKEMAQKEYEARMLAIEKDYYAEVWDISTKAYNARANNDDLRQQAKLAKLQQGSLEYMEEEVALAKYRLDTIYQLETESDEAFYLRKVQAEQDYLKTKKNLTKQQIALAQQGAAGVSSILGSLADMYENDTDATEEQLRAAKGMRIAGATIDMLSGVVSAISTAQKLGPIAGPIMAAINSAAVIASGVANIAKIKQQDTSKNNTSTATPTSVSAATSAPAVIQQVEVTRTLTGATEEARLNRMAEDQRVYLVYDDVEQAGRRVEVQDTESTF